MPQLDEGKLVGKPGEGDMRQRVQKRLRGFARTMRVEATDAERRMWTHLRGGRLAGLKFRRQVPIGGAIVDFVCYEHRLIVELDGGHHSGNVRDARRDADLRRRGFTVLRFWNNDVRGTRTGFWRRSSWRQRSGPLTLRA